MYIEREIARERERCVYIYIYIHMYMYNYLCVTIVTCMAVALEREVFLCRLSAPRDMERERCNVRLRISVHARYVCMRVLTYAFMCV